MLRSCAAGPATLLVPLAAVTLLVGCAQDRANEPTASSTSATASATSAATATPVAPPPSSSAPQAPAGPTTEQPQPQPQPQPTVTPPSTAAAEPGVPQPCSDDDLTITGGQVESVDTTRRVVVSFANSGSGMCTLVGYPGADLVGGAGGVLVHVARRPANAAPRLELQPGEVATADVQTSTIDSATGDPCGRIGTLVVTAPDTVEARLLQVNLPICDASISSVG